MATILELHERFLGPGALVGGVLSGTSADGIDVALVRVRARRVGGERAALRGARDAFEIAGHELVAFTTREFPRELAARVRAVLDGGACGLRESALLGRDLGRAFGDAAREFASAREHTLDLVGSHGQTVWHHDGREASGAATLQLGDGDFVAESARCWVASDFRQRDVAAGGEGAPLSALADELLFARAPRPCAILNLGGMANVTWIGARSDELIAFDTGPANSLLDGLARALFGRSFDEGGALAARGRADERFVARLLEHPFLHRPPPKSTGRDTFGATWVAGVVDRWREGPGRDEESSRFDLLATAAEFVAASVALGLAHVRAAPGTLVHVAGGGVHHAVLMSALERRSGLVCRASDDCGVPADAREGLVFALLGACCALGIARTRRSVTGATAGRILGKLSPAPPS